MLLSLTRYRCRLVLFADGLDDWEQICHDLLLAVPDPPQLDRQHVHRAGLVVVTPELATLLRRSLFCCGTVQAVANALGGTAVKHATAWRTEHAQLWACVAESCQAAPADALAAALEAFDSDKAARGMAMPIPAGAPVLAWLL